MSGGVILAPGQKQEAHYPAWFQVSDKTDSTEPAPKLQHTRHNPAKGRFKKVTKTTRNDFKNKRRDKARKATIRKVGDRRKRRGKELIEWMRRKKG